MNRSRAIKGWMTHFRQLWKRTLAAERGYRVHAGAIATRRTPVGDATFDRKMDAVRNRTQGAVTPPTWLATQVRTMIVRNGELATADRLQISKSAATRMAAQLPVRRGTITQVLKALDLKVPF